VNLKMVYHKEIEKILPAIENAGVKMMKYFLSSNYSVKMKSKHNPVTDADFAANEILVKAIHENFPGDAILSEEEISSDNLKSVNQSRFSSARIWILDPLDGTNEFIKGNAEFCISLGLIDMGKPVLGFIYNPAKKFIIYGWKNHVTIEYGNCNEYYEKKAGFRVCVSRTEYKNNSFHYLKGWDKLAEIIPIGSVAFKLGLVGAGKFDLPCL